MEMRLDPWGHMVIEDYERLLSEFGIKPVRELLGKYRLDHFYFTREIVFGHRDLDIWLESLYAGKKVAVLTGFMPSGEPHLGTAMVYEELKYLQSKGAFVKIVIADAEAYVVRKEDRRSVVEQGLKFIAHSLAWGINPEKAEFYYQTEMSTPYYRLIQMFSRKVTFAEMEAIYGEITPSKIIAALTQAADILHLQLDEYGGYKHVLVPVGADQDPHLRLTRDLADRFENELELKRPSSMYHKLIRGLDGNKMSKSRPEYAIHLSDPVDLAEKKLMNALTGGRATAEEQRRLGGEPWKCMVFELYMYHLVRDDKLLSEIREECISGKILCGQCKRRAAEMLRELLVQHQKALSEQNAEGLVKKVVKVPKF
ncbi:MAG: tryptophan--tRNA ligase [Desulfurococcaceae archaeon]